MYTRKTLVYLKNGILYPLLLLSFHSYAQTHWQHWQTVGNATFSWFIFDVFNATLKNPTGVWDEIVADNSSYALQIQYYRNISHDDLLEATQEQWQHLNYSEQQISAWSKLITRGWADIRKHDSLVFVVNGPTGSFYSQRNGEQSWQLTLTFENRELCNAFISIWLSPNTKYPDFRNNLLRPPE